ncbi:hypothetical protein BH09BAC2_BH09BAC2_04510 [soil metagenome]
MAQEHFIDPARLLTKFKFSQLTGGVMLIKAQLNNLPDTLNFILDTGSGGISLDSTTCSYLKIAHEPSGKTISGIAGVKKVDFVKNRDLILPGLAVKSLDFYVNDYEILTSVYGEKIDGIIGYSFLSKYLVKVNNDSLTVEVYQPGEIRYPRGGHLLHPTFTTLPIQRINIQDARAVNANFYFDTGAGLNFLLNKEFVSDSAFLLKSRRPVYTQAEGLGGKKEMQLTIIREIKFGPYTFRRVPTHLFDDDYNVTSYPFLGGLIGMDLLRRFNIILNYPKKEIHLIPNSHFKEAFDYAYTGMSIYNIDKKIIADDIVPGSPADKAGFLKNDIIISINNNLSNNLAVYKNLFQAASEKIKVIVLRNGEPVMLTFKAGRIH